MSYPEALTWFIILYLAITGGGLFGIYQLSRIWRIVIYVLLGAGHIFCAFLWHGLSFIDRKTRLSKVIFCGNGFLRSHLLLFYIHIIRNPEAFVDAVLISGF